MDIDALEKQFNAYKETSVGSNLSASNISIKSGNTATIRGSQLQGNTSIDSQALNILASQDISTRSDSSEHKNIHMSMSSSGGASMSASADSSQSSSTSVVHTNSGITGGNVRINTKGKTTIAGGNLSGHVDLTTGSLEVSSVQDSDKSRSSSMGLSVFRFQKFTNMVTTILCNVYVNTNHPPKPMFGSGGSYAKRFFLIYVHLQ